MTKNKSKRHTVESEISLDEVESPSRTVYLVGEINEELVKSTVEHIVTLAEHNVREPITLIINTMGGNIDEAFMLYDLIKFIKTPIHTVGLGKIMSAGCLLLAAGTKGHRTMGKNARLMYHAGWMYTIGTIWEIKAEVESFEKQEKTYDECFAAETGMTLADVERLYSKDGPTRNHYLTAQEAKTLGIVDLVI